MRAWHHPLTPPGPVRRPCLAGGWGLDAEGVAAAVAGGAPRAAALRVPRAVRTV